MKKSNSFINIYTFFLQTFFLYEKIKCIIEHRRSPIPDGNALIQLSERHSFQRVFLFYYENIAKERMNKVSESFVRTFLQFFFASCTGSMFTLFHLEFRRC